jgi:hypothetical protein
MSVDPVLVFLLGDTPPERVVCSYCERSRVVRTDGRVRVHQSTASHARCRGSLTDHRNHCPSPYPR